MKCRNTNQVSYSTTESDKSNNMVVEQPKVTVTKDVQTMVEHSEQLTTEGGYE